MNKEIQDRIQFLREKIRHERTIIASLESQLKDSYMKQLIQGASNTLDDVEDFFLGSLERESRSPSAESNWIANAEFVFHQLAVPQRQHVQNIIEKYGPDVISIPSPLVL